MTAPYKKRAKSGWNNDKKQSNKDERAFEKRELEGLSSGIEENKLLPISKKKKKKQLKAKDIANKIRDTERKIEFFSNGYFTDWCKGIVARYKRQLVDLQELYNELKEK